MPKAASCAAEYSLDISEESSFFTFLLFDSEVQN